MTDRRPGVHQLPDTIKRAHATLTELLETTSSQ